LSNYRTARTIPDMRTALLALALLALASCGDNLQAVADAPPGTPDGPTVTPLNACTAFEDRTTSSTITISFPTGTGPSQYSPACIKVKTGTQITWTGAFANHPLRHGAAPGLGTDSPGNPIQDTNTGGTMTFTFGTTGTFGFFCNFHPGLMRGAVQVTQ